jgi:hypothetical protein
MTPMNQSGVFQSTPLKPHKHMDHVFAIVRVDTYSGLDVPDEERISVKEVLWDAEAARLEVERLNGLKKGKSRYFLQVTRLERKDCAAPPATTAAESSFNGQAGGDESLRHMAES